jgi:hypothetical protein
MKFDRSTASMFRAMWKTGGIVGVVDVVDASGRTNPSGSFAIAGFGCS